MRASRLVGLIGDPPLELVHEECGPVLVGLIGDPPLELVSANPGAMGRIERHCPLDPVRLLLLRRPDALGTHGGASGEGRAQEDREDDGQEEEGET
jgi:hypothetical protein